MLHTGRDTSYACGDCRSISRRSSNASGVILLSRGSGPGCFRERMPSRPEALKARKMRRTLSTCKPNTAAMSDARVFCEEDATI